VLVNAGTIVSDAPGMLVVRGSSWTNAGTLRAEGGDLAAVDTWTNDGLAWCGAHDVFTGGSVTQSELGTLRVDLASSAAYGALEASGPVALDGTLELVLVEGFVPSPGASFIVLTSSALTGTFDSLLLPAEVSWDIAYDAGSVTLTVLP
jgi:hypothetical protein